MDDILDWIGEQLLRAEHAPRAAREAQPAAHAARRMRRWLRRPLVVAGPEPVRRGPPARLGRAIVAAPRGWAALAGTTGAAAAVVAALVLTAGAAPSAAQAFPILATKATDVRTDAIHVPRGIFRSGLADAHAFSEPYGTGYVLQPDANTLCVLLPGSPGSAPGGASPAVFGCGSTAQLEQQGEILAFDYFSSVNVFVALVPVGGSLSVTADGTTTAVPVTNGIASGLVQQSETLTLQVGSSTTTKQVTPNTTPLPSARSAPPSSVGPTGESGASGATS